MQHEEAEGEGVAGGEEAGVEEEPGEETKMGPMLPQERWRQKA